MPVDLTLINDDEEKIYLVKIKNFEEINFNKDLKYINLILIKRLIELEKVFCNLMIIFLMINIM